MVPMTCPSCGAESSLEMWIAHEEMRGVAAEIIRRKPLGAYLLHYVNLFRPAKNRMRPARAMQLLADLFAVVDAGVIAYNGRQWAAPVEIWRSGLEAMLAKADAGKLSLPLSNHNYLYKIMADLCDKVEAANEQAREQALRHGPREGVNAGPQRVSARPIDPELQKIRSTRADPMPAAVREKFETLKKGN